MATPLVRVSYKNVSGADVPPYGIIQLTGAPVVTATGDYVLQATNPGSGSGPYMIDTGKGAKSSGAKQYGSCARAIDGLVWVAYGCGGGPPSNWCSVGPVNGNFYVNETGAGYTYAGQYDATNQRILVMMNSFSPLVGYCSSSSGSSASSSSSKSSSSGSSGSSSSSSNCVTVVTNVTCSGGNLVVTYGQAAKCGLGYVLQGQQYRNINTGDYIDVVQ